MFLTWKFLAEDQQASDPGIDYMHSLQHVIQFHVVNKASLDRMKTVLKDYFPHRLYDQLPPRWPGIAFGTDLEHGKGMFSSLRHPSILKNSECIG